MRTSFHASFNKKRAETRTHSVVCKAQGSRRASATTTRLPDRQARERDDARLQALAKVASKQVNRVAQQRQKQLEDQDALVERAKELQPFKQQVVDHLQKGGSDADARARPTRSRSFKRAGSHSLAEGYKAVFTTALDLELAEEWGEALQRLKTWTRQRLIAEGVALFDLWASADGQLYRDAIVKLYVPNMPLPPHNLGQGDVVLISRGDPLAESAHEGLLLDYGSRWIRVALPLQSAAAVAGGGWRVDLFANTVAHERSRAAVARFSERVAGEGPGDDGASLPLLKLLAGTVPPGMSLDKAASATPSWLRGGQGQVRLAKAKAAAAATSAHLNPSQQAAVATTLKRTLTLWQGPPGTGKTRTLLRFVEAALACLPPKAQVLATAASNVAVDNMVAGLLELGIRVVRVGRPASVSPALREVTLEALALQTQPGRQVLALRQQAAQLSGEAARSAFARAMQLEALAFEEVLCAAKVVAATCIGAGDPRLEGRHFAVCVADEAAQATEPHSMVAMASCCEALLLVGDPQQLPPTVRSRTAAELGLGCSLMERLQAMGLPALLLDTQYRMHPGICEFPSKRFYAGKLKSQPKPSDRPHAPGVAWPSTVAPVAFVDVKGEEKRTTSVTDDLAAATGFSYYNPQEAAAVVAVVQQLLSTGQLCPDDIGVITPYNGQVKCISQLLAAANGGGSASQAGRRGGNSKRRALQASVHEQQAAGSGAGAGKRPASKGRPQQRGQQQQEQEVPVSQRTGLSAVEVRSVDGFQGREKEVIVFSAVRSNAQCSVGFLADYRRLNVALTRAKRGLVVLGSSETLGSNTLWRSWLQWASRRRVVVQDVGALLGRAAPTADE